MQKLVIASVILVSSIISHAVAMEKTFEFKQTSVRASEQLGNVKLLRNKNGFCVMRNGTPYEVKDDFVDSLLRNASKKTLKKFQKAGYVEIKRLDNDEFVLRSKVRGMGGGPVLAGILYGATKFIGTTINQATGEEGGRCAVMIATQAATGSEVVATAISNTPGVAAAATLVIVEVASIGMGIIGAIIPSC